MLEMTYGELFLFLWAVVATGLAWQYRAESRNLKDTLIGAAIFTKRLVSDDKIRDQLKEILARDKEAEFKFGGEHE